MILPLPATFNPELSSDRLEAVSQWLLDELVCAEDDLSRPTDNGYTRGCTTFGRQRNRIIAEALSARHVWLGLPNSNNDIVFSVAGVPCRFSNDDPSNPSKDAVLTANRYQMDFLEFATDSEPARFCFLMIEAVMALPNPGSSFSALTQRRDRLPLGAECHAPAVLADIAGHPMSRPVETRQFPGVQMQQLTRGGALVTKLGRGFLQRR